MLNRSIVLAGAFMLIACDGEAPPPEFSRPEVAEILMDYYKSLK